MAELAARGIEPRPLPARSIVRLSRATRSACGLGSGGRASQLVAGSQACCGVCRRDAVATCRRQRRSSLDLAGWHRARPSRSQARLRRVASRERREGGAAILGGTLYESAHLLLPRLARRSRLYEATARNALRIATELVGGVEGATREPVETPAKELAARKVAGNVVEVGSIAAFGFSPLWLLAGASDVLHGSRVYLGALVSELKAAGVVAQDAYPTSLEDLLAGLEGASGGAARLIDIPPLELAELRRSLEELRADAGRLPSPGELSRLFEGLRPTAAAERVSLLGASSAIGLAFLVSARKVGGPMSSTRIGRIGGRFATRVPPATRAGSPAPTGRPSSRISTGGALR